MTSEHGVPLREIPVGRRVRIRQLRSAPEVCYRLRELGLGENAILRCLAKVHGNVICEVYNTRIGLDDALAGTIVVSAF